MLEHWNTGLVKHLGIEFVAVKEKVVAKAEDPGRAPSPPGRCMAAR
jgi:hypothetical protein